MSDRIIMSWHDDDYTLGIVCKKTGLVRTALNQLTGLTSKRERWKIFVKGVADADSCELCDIAG